MPCHAMYHEPEMSEDLLSDDILVVTLIQHYELRTSSVFGFHFTLLSSHLAINTQNKEGVASRFPPYTRLRYSSLQFALASQNTSARIPRSILITLPFPAFLTCSVHGI